MADISTIFGDTFLLLSWLGILCLSIYLMYQIVSYLSQKPPNAQTLLDGLYIQMFCIWIFEVLVAVVFNVTVGLNITNDDVSFIVGNTLCVAVLLSAISLLLSSWYRIIMINSPTIIEHIPDNDILLYSM